jgi:hypothetical protein
MRKMSVCLLEEAVPSYMNFPPIPSKLLFFNPISNADRVPEGRSGPAYNLVLENKPIPAKKLDAVRITYQEEAFDYELDYS